MRKKTKRNSGRRGNSESLGKFKNRTFLSLASFLPAQTLVFEHINVYGRFN